MKDKRKFDGKVYELSACKKIKQEALNYAKRYRNMGYKARVIKVKVGSVRGYCIYTRAPFYRKY